jgi:hypothetical protein
MQKHLLESFDEALTALQDAKKLYVKKNYWNAFRMTEKAKGLLFELAGHIELDISLGQKQSRRALSETDTQRLAGLNNSLINLQRIIRKETDRIVMDCQERMMSPNEDFLSDCVVGIEIQFYLDETDPHYGEDRDSILAEIKFDGKNLSRYEGANWNEVDHDSALEKRHYHCWLYHELNTGVQPSLEWEDLLRIGYIWTDIRIRYQNEVRLPAM